MHTLLDFGEQAVERLFEEGCRLVIVACNTMSCVALRHLQRHYCPPGGDRRVLGVTIPAAEAAVAHSAGHIGVLATRRTIASGTYPTEIRKLSPGHRVTSAAAPLLASIVEEGWEDTDVAREAVRRYLAPLAGIDTLVLGCTHYPFLEDAFRAALPAHVHLLDPAPHVALRLATWMERHPGFVEPGSGRLRVLCTGDPSAFVAHGTRFLARTLPQVETIAEVGGRLAPREGHVEPRGQVVRPKRDRADGGTAG
ncbi:MAG: aspartate/glutamate racemase family protein [Myxococcales bacterium]|nr:aspartate/glutamate racemase family protein [Myxococcales bacterium]